GNANKILFVRLFVYEAASVLGAAQVGDPLMTKQLLCFTMALVWASSPAPAQQPGPLQEQLQQLKQQYLDTTRELEHRIAALARQIADQKETRAQTRDGTVSAAELVAQETQKAVLGHSHQVGAGFQGQLPSEPSYDLLREADKKVSKLQEQVN